MVRQFLGRARADVVHDNLRVVGFGGSERTTRRTVARARKAYTAGHRPVFRPWIPEPEMGLQFDWAEARGSSAATRCCGAPGPLVEVPGRHPDLVVVPAHVVDKLRALVLGMGLSKLHSDGGFSCFIGRPS